MALVESPYIHAQAELDYIAVEMSLYVLSSTAPPPHCLESAFLTCRVCQEDLERRFLQYAA